ncbi:uncharacterized protein LY89DRAFT_594345 [Mollisia scopiformis]|uniref:Proteophosphoglycan 5 n=1 Tax=Mollisia scopiformis TaxID=149040 RepID=A0A194WW16_MOLSC|nr:uncharacterized protein LY89DRAFT_594345 [Mollisia scopiformis]KUJ11777.1 hypothetical protein LY89DRAFT_594345 [Mollisia scopiformis]
MSADTPTRGHRHTRSAAIPGIAASSQNPRNPHHLNQHAHARNSQSDMNNNGSDQVLQPATPPRTPRRDNQVSSQNPSNSAASGTGSKQKSRNKNRPKNVMTSPVTTRNDRNTPPFAGVQSAGIPSSAKPMNTPSVAAYAGPTFHASPAPSALPIPSFYSKSVPESPAAKGLKSLKGGPLATPPHALPSAQQSRREESPLDLFFKADREEKARAHSANQATAAAGPFQPPIGPSRASQTPPATSSLVQPRQGSSNRQSTGGIFAMELDGEREAGTPYGPAFSTPYSERINAARNNQQTRSVDRESPITKNSLDKSEALKAYLFSGASILLTTKEEDPNLTSVDSLALNSYQSPPGSLNGPRSAGLPQQTYYNGYQQSFDSKHSTNTSRLPGRSSGLRQEVTPTKTPTSTFDRTGACSNSPTPARGYGNAPLSGAPQVHSNIPQNQEAPPLFNVASGSRNSDLQGIEDSLRKILKLDSAGSSGVSIAPTAQQATVSVPKYGGGRPQPMNGMHNGVTRS